MNSTQSASIAVVSCLLLAVLPALASHPGRPQNCSDWEITEPGIVCRDWVPYPCAGGQYGCGIGTGSPSIDAKGDVIDVRTTNLPSIGLCLSLSRTEIVRRVREVVTVIAGFQDRCVDPLTGRTDRIRPMNSGGALDATNGRYLFGVVLSCDANVAGACTGTYETGAAIVELAGFASLFDVLQTFTPQSGLGLRVPVMPEGFRAADHFDTYVGAVTRPLDLSQATPLQCNYPATPPHAGDRLAITAPVPTPAPGTATYILTSATYQGQTRAGRRAAGGRLFGRDAGQLPECTSTLAVGSEAQ